MQSSEHTREARTEDSERLRGLLAAHRRITGDLSLAAVLRRIVDASCDLVGCAYGALAVLDRDGSLEHFVQHGLDEATSRRLAALPHGHRIDTAHLGFGSFLGVPITVRGTAVGELYLADPRTDQFDLADEDLLGGLAATAGTAIENARLYDEAQRSRDWLDASGEIARTLLRDADNEVLPDLLARAFRLADADYACLILPVDGGDLRVTAAIGIGAEDFRGIVFDPTESVFGKTIVAAEAIRTHDMTLWARLDFENRHDFGPAMVIPLVAHGDRGAVLMMRLAGQAPFTARDLELASTFAAQVALAMELSTARAEGEQLRTLEERDRIAQDLHDNVMQRLFATGVGLQALLGQIPDPDVAERLRRHIADLDETLDEIRCRIFGLRGAGRTAALQ